MKLLVFAALAATLSLCTMTAQDKAGTGTPATAKKADLDALTPEQVAIWRNLNGQIAQANEALAEKDKLKDKALVAYYEARDTAQKIYSDSNAAWLKLAADAKRDGYTVDPKTLRWVKVPVAAQTGGK